MIDLSVVIVSWETRDLLLDCLESATAALAELAHRPDSVTSEIFVVDNGSQDGSAAAVRQHHEHVQLIELPRNVGYAAGNNAALLGARGRIVLLLNTDVVLEAAAVRVALALFEERADAGVVGVQMMHGDGRKQNSIHRFPGLASEFVPLFVLETLFPRRFPSKRSRLDGPAEVDAVLGAALFVRRVAVDQVGPLCEDYFFFLEETDWCWRMQASGWRVLFAPGARLVHHSGGSSKRRFPAATRIEFHRSLYRFLRDRRGPGTAGIARLLRTLRGGVDVFLAALVSPLSTKARARLADRGALLAWHLRGCPADAGLSAMVDADPRTGNPLTLTPDSTLTPDPADEPAEERNG